MKQYRSKKAGKEIIRTYNELLTQWGVEYEEKMINTRYGQTHVTVWGKVDGAPLVLFHGVGDDTALMWVYNAKALGERLRLYAIDTIGGPGKSVMGEAYNKEFDDVLWIDDILDGLKLRKTSVAGVSHGGYLVQLYTVRRPERVDKPIILASSVAARKDGKKSNPLKAMMKIFLPEALFPTTNNIKKLLTKLSGDNPQAFTENALLLEHFTWLLKGFNNMAMGYHKLETLTVDEVDIIRNRAHFLVGLEDPFEKLGGEAALRDMKMNAKFYKGVGHGINHEIPEEVNKEIISIMCS